MNKRKFYPLYYAGAKQRFARAVVVGDLIFLSGSSGRTLETGEVSSSDIKEQTRVAVEKIRLALEEVGSSLENIVKLTMYLRDMRHYDAVYGAMYDYFSKYAPRLINEPPAITVVQVVSLSKPDMLVEIDAIAVKP